MEQQRKLYSLKGSDYQIVDGEPNILGWKVKNENDSSIGEIKDLLFDADSNAVRYLVIDLAESSFALDKTVLVPIGIAHLHVKDDEVVLPNIHYDQFLALPAYDEDNVGPETERLIRAVIGSPAALRIEETTVQHDISDFYNHHHFDRGRFYTRGGYRQAASIVADDETKQPFRIEVAAGSHARFYNIQPLGNHRYEIKDDEGTVGTILLDENDHARCESIACELDLPLLHAIRQGIQSHENWRV